MGTSVRSAALYSLGQRYVGFLINIVSTIILARLLTPRETGVYSLSLAIIFIANTLRDFGLGEYVVQARDLTREMLRATYTASIAIAWSMGAAMVLFATPLASFFHEEGVRQVLRVLAINFALLPIGSTAFALLTKELAFGKIFWVQTLSNLSGTLLSIFLAFRGYSYMSLAWGSLASAVITSAHLALIRPADTFLLPGLKGIHSVIKFGGALTVGRIADQIGGRLPDLIIGRFLGFSAVGLNSKSGSLISAFFDFFVTAVLRVATPALSKCADEQSFRTSYLHLLTLVSLLQLLFFGFLLLYAHRLIEVLFGGAWLECTPLLRIGAIGGLLWTPYMLISSALTAKGEALKQMRIQIFTMPFGIAMVMIGAQYSILAVAALGQITILLRLILVEKTSRAALQIHFGELLRAIRPSLQAAAIGLAIAALPLGLENRFSSFVQLLLGSLCAALGALAGSLAVCHPIVPEAILMFGQLRSFRRNA